MAEFNELVIELQGEYKGVTEAFKQLTTTIGGFSSALKTALAPLQQYKSTLDGLDKIIKSQSALGKQTNNSIAQTGAVSRKAASDTDILYKKINALAVAYDRLGQKSTAKRLRSLGAETVFSNRQREAMNAVYATQGISKGEATALNTAIMSGANQEIRRTGEVSKTASEKTAILQKELNKLATVYAKLGQTNRAGQLRQFSGSLGLGEKQLGVQQLAGGVGLDETQKSALSGILLNPQQLEQVLKGSNNAVKDLAANGAKASTSLSGMMNLGKLTASLYLIRRIGNALANVVKEAIDFVETLNLFQTALGSYAGQATEFVNKMSTGFGMSETTLMKYTGLFYQMATSMGVANENAYVLSENFTKLAVDLASYFNISIESANEKLQAALAGQIRPLRELGLDISETALQEEARRLGIEKSIEVMTAAEKIQLRYNAITRQSKNAHGDFAKTIGTVSNQTKILSENMLKLKKAWGEILMPALEDALPIVNGLVSGLTYLGQSLANIAGYKVKEFGGALNELGELDEEAENVLDTVNKLNKATMGFDELNILSQKQSGSDSLAFELEGYENGLNDIKDIVAEMGGMGLMLQKAFKGLGEILENVAPLTVFLGSSLLTYFSISAVGKLVTGIGKIGAALTGTFSVGAVGAIAALAVGLASVVSYLDKLAKERIGNAVAQQLGKIKLEASDTDTLIGSLDKSMKDLYITASNSDSNLEIASKALDKTKKSVDKLFEGFDNAAKDAPSDMDAIREAITNMSNDSKTALDSFFDGIKNEWGNIFGGNGELLNKLTLFEEGMKLAYTRIGTEIEQIYKQAADKGGMFTEDAESRLKQLLNLQYELANADTLKEQLYQQKSREQLLGQIQGGEISPESLRSLVNEISSSIETSMKKLNDYTLKQEASFEYMQQAQARLIETGIFSQDELANYGLSDANLEAFKASLEKFKTEQSQEIIENISDVLNTISTYAESEKIDITNESLIEKLFGHSEFSYKMGKIASKIMSWFGNDTAQGYLADTEINEEMQSILDLINNLKGIYGFANGGYPELGELFVANEFGVEAMGKVGGRTAVVNNQQIALAFGHEIYPAMYNAIIDGLKSSNGLMPTINLKVGNDVIAKATKDGNRYSGNNFSTLSGGNVV